MSSNLNAQWPNKLFAKRNFHHSGKVWKQTCLKAERIVAWIWFDLWNHGTLLYIRMKRVGDRIPLHIGSKLYFQYKRESIRIFPFWVLKIKISFKKRLIFMKLFLVLTYCWKYGYQKAHQHDAHRNCMIKTGHFRWIHVAWFIPKTQAVSSLSSISGPDLHRGFSRKQKTFVWISSSLEGLSIEALREIRRFVSVYFIFGEFCDSERHLRLALLSWAFILMSSQARWCYKCD